MRIMHAFMFSHAAGAFSILSHTALLTETIRAYSFQPDPLTHIMKNARRYETTELLLSMLQHLLFRLWTFVHPCRNLTGPRVWHAGQCTLMRSFAFLCYTNILPQGMESSTRPQVNAFRSYSTLPTSRNVPRTCRTALGIEECVYGQKEKRKVETLLGMGKACLPCRLVFGRIRIQSHANNVLTYCAAQEAEEGQ